MTADASVEKRRDFRWLGSGSACNGLGMAGEQVVVGLLIFEIGGSSAWVGISLALYFAPMLFCGGRCGIWSGFPSAARLN